MARNDLMGEWHEAAPLLAPALNGTHTLEDVQREIESNRAQLWPLGRSAVVTQVCDYPQMRVLRVWLAGGVLTDLLRGLPVLDELARELDCTRIELDGRKGWERVLPGYKAERVVLTKDV